MLTEYFTYGLYKFVVLIDYLFKIELRRSFIDHLFSFRMRYSPPISGVGQVSVLQLFL